MVPQLAVFRTAKRGRASSLLCFPFADTTLGVIPAHSQGSTRCMRVRGRLRQHKTSALPEVRRPHGGCRTRLGKGYGHLDPDCDLPQGGGMKLHSLSGFSSVPVSSRCYHDALKTGWRRRRLPVLEAAGVHGSGHSGLSRYGVPGGTGGRLRSTSGGTRCSRRVEAESSYLTMEFGFPAASPERGRLAFHSGLSWIEPGGKFPLREALARSSSTLADAASGVDGVRVAIGACSGACGVGAGSWGCARAQQGFFPCLCSLVFTLPCCLTGSHFGFCFSSVAVVWSPGLLRTGPPGLPRSSGRAVRFSDAHAFRVLAAGYWLCVSFVRLFRFGETT
ncbi:unnamed protein product [Amoebophrya sp. A120]|nr:unnamed protein product [Amoebophrya sp. A120]|eukprot:GSA120T00008409001.1